MTARIVNPCVILFCVVMTVGVVSLQGCSKPQPPLPPPHALEDAAAASQRASEGMKGGGDPQGHTQTTGQSGADKAKGHE
jgi:hypothetical protein